MADNLSSMIGKLAADDLEVDNQGRVLIKNPEVAKALQEAVKRPESLAADHTNLAGCINNQCARPQLSGEMTRTRG